MIVFMSGGSKSLLYLVLIYNTNDWMKIIRTGLLFLVYLKSFFSFELNSSALNKTCPFAHYLTINGECTQCSAYCPTCKSLSNTCTKCTQGLIFESFNDVCRNCDFGISQCKDKNICFPYFMKKNNICEPQCFVPNCKNCFLDLCITCFQGYELSNDNTTCTITTKSNIRINQPTEKQRDKPGDCSLREYFSESTLKCQKCDQRCITCLKFSTNCMVCQRQYFKNGWKCIKLSYVLVNLDLGSEQVENISIAEGEINNFKMQLALILRNAKGNQGHYGAQNISLGKFVQQQNSSLFNLQFFLDAEKDLWGIQEMMDYLNQTLKENRKIGVFKIKKASIKNSTSLNFEKLKKQQEQSHSMEDLNGNTKNNKNISNNQKQQNDSYFLIIVLIIASVLGLISIVVLISIFCWCRKKDFDQKAAKKRAECQQHIFNIIESQMRQKAEDHQQQAKNLKIQSKNQSILKQTERSRMENTKGQASGQEGHQNSKSPNLNMEQKKIQFKNQITLSPSQVIKKASEKFSNNMLKENVCPDLETQRKMIGQTQ